MDVQTKNTLLLQNEMPHSYEITGLFPNIEELKNQAISFDVHFGLDQLPETPGLILVRGARQFGKSTWLEQQAWESWRRWGPGSVLLLNGDEIIDWQRLYEKLVECIRAFSPDQPIKRLFIDEITAVENWERAIKRVYDEGLSRKILIVTTGSKATDLRRGKERLPGRKGRLNRTNYVFTPISYAEFESKCRKYFGADSWIVYLLTGGSPLAANEFISHGFLPEYVLELTRDWILGECAAAGRSRTLLTWIARRLIQGGGNPVPLVTLAREAGVANATVLQGYLDLLQDTLCLSQGIPVEAGHFHPIPKKAKKFHWINSLAALAFSTDRIRSVEDWKRLPETEQAKWLEWLVAQELWRKAAVSGAETPELMYYWQSSEHELDFVTEDRRLIEVKRGKAGPLDFLWFPKIFPKSKLQVVTSTPFHCEFARGIDIENFLKEAPHGNLV
ncbi:AAA family ATPase [Bdellovibrionota bacterium FG-1]